VAVDHTCPVAWAQDRELLAGTPIDVSWCLSYKRELVAALALPDPMSPELLLWHHGPLSVFYAPSDWVNTAASVMLVGITPGSFQATEALREAQRCLQEGLTNEETLQRANAVGSFSGPMRANLITMLDGIGLNAALGIDSAARLFDTHHHLVAKASAISYPLFVNGQNYHSGNPSLIRHPVLRSFVRASLGPQVAMAPAALVVPLGMAAQRAVTLLIADGLLDWERCLMGFPHPSSANGSRVRHYTVRREILRQSVAYWAAGSNPAAAPQHRAPLSNDRHGPGATGQTSRTGHAVTGPEAGYIDARVIAAFKTQEDTDRFDRAKLLQLIGQLNDNYARGNGYAAHVLLRAILDHIPPLLGCSDFAAVANNYPWSRTDKAYMRRLMDFKLQAHDVLHRQISPKTDLLGLDDIPPRAWVNRLLQECAS
jgi:hypothetical protein